jgi:hypothetical protein
MNAFNAAVEPKSSTSWTAVDNRYALKGMSSKYLLTFENVEENGRALSLAKLHVAREAAQQMENAAKDGN